MADFRTVRQIRGGGHIEYLPRLGNFESSDARDGHLQRAFFTGFKAISFIVGTTNSYFWNKFWTFGSKLPVTVSEYVRFGAFTLVGVAINVTVASLVVNVIGVPAGIDPRIWANVGAITAVFSAMFWNFLTYKKIVFKENQNG